MTETNREEQLKKQIEQLKNWRKIEEEKEDCDYSSIEWDNNVKEHIKLEAELKCYEKGKQQTLNEVEKEISEWIDKHSKIDVNNEYFEVDFDDLEDLKQVIQKLRGKRRWRQNEIKRNSINRICH